MGKDTFYDKISDIFRDNPDEFFTRVTIANKARCSYLTAQNHIKILLLRGHIKEVKIGNLKVLQLRRRE